jgi:hypothetical protein
MRKTTIAPGFAVVNGVLYCFGGANQGYPTGSTSYYKYVQAYTP